MRASTFTLAAIGLLAAAAPASALTSQSASETRAGPVVASLNNDPVNTFAGGASNFRWAIAGDDSSVGGLPVYYEPGPSDAKDLGALYAADPARYMAHVDAAQPTTATVQASPTAPKAPQGR